MGKLGAKVTVRGPKTLMPGNMESVYDCRVEYDLAKALKDADVVMGLIHNGYNIKFPIMI